MRFWQSGSRGRALADDLLARLEPLTHDARVRELVALGRASKDDAGSAAALTDLEGRGFYERYLALLSCYGSRDGAHVLRALADPSRTVRALAVALTPVACDDAQAADALALLRPSIRRRLARRLRLTRRQGPIDALLDRLAAAGDPALADLLPYGSAGIVSSHLPGVEEGAGIAFWTRLARQHPDLAAETLAMRVATMAEGDPRLPWRVNATLPVLIRARPDAALTLARSLAERVPLPSIALAPVLARRPAGVVDLVLRSDDQVWLPLDRAVPRLDLERLRALLSRLPAAHNAVQNRFRYLRPDTRAALFDEFGQGWRDGLGCVGIAVLRELPSSSRLPEARRHLELPALATRPLQRLPYAGLLPWDEARALLGPSLGSPDPDLRAAALSALTATVRYERGRAGELLALLRARRNEQDPVRLAGLSGLADLPPGTWRAEHLDGLEGVIRDALDAADLSAATAAQAGRLVAALFPFHPAWAAGWMATLAQERGYLPLDNLERRLTDADIARVAPILLPVLRAWETRERERYVLDVAASLGRRLRLVDELGEILGRVAGDTRSSWAADRALLLLRRHQPARFAALAPALLRRDESVATLASVWDYLSRRRQDLLTPYLGQRVYAGRFTTGKTHIVLPFASGFHRWTPARQAIFAATLRAVTHRNPTTQDTPAILRGITGLAALQTVPAGYLVELTGRANGAVRDAALRALGRLDDTAEAVPALLAALDDDRARVAVYALRRALLDMPAARAVAVLETVPLDRVTVAKEVARLYGDLPTPAAFDRLRELSRRDLHRDVRVALLRALWGHLDRPEAWALLEEAAASPDPALARSTMRIPSDRLSRDGQRRLVALLGRLLEHPDPTVRLAVAERCAALPVADPDRLLLARLLDRLASPAPDERAAAAGAVFATCQERDAAGIGAAVVALLPDRRALLTVVESLSAAAVGARGRLLPVSHAVLDALAADRLTASLQVRLAARALPWAELGSVLSRMGEAGELHSDALSTACEALVAAARRPDAAALDGLERELSASTDRYVRRLGLAALVGLAGPPRGWDAERLARLRAYRADPAALVAAAAQFTLPAEELSS